MQVFVVSENHSYKTHTLIIWSLNVHSRPMVFWFSMVLKKSWSTTRILDVLEFNRNAFSMENSLMVFSPYIDSLTRVEFSKSNLNFTRGTIVGRGHWQARASIEKGTAAAPASGGRRCWSLFFCAYYKNTHYKYITVKKANGAKKGGFGFQIVRIYCEIWQFFVAILSL